MLVCWPARTKRRAALRYPPLLGGSERRNACKTPHPPCLSLLRAMPYRHPIARTNILPTSPSLARPLLWATLPHLPQVCLMITGCISDDLPATTGCIFNLCVCAAGADRDLGVGMRDKSGEFAQTWPPPSMEAASGSEEDSPRRRVLLSYRSPIFHIHSPPCTSSSPQN